MSNDSKKYTLIKLETFYPNKRLFFGKRIHPKRFKKRALYLERLRETNLRKLNSQNFKIKKVSHNSRRYFLKSIFGEDTKSEKNSQNDNTNNNDDDSNLLLPWEKRTKTIQKRNNFFKELKRPNGKILTKKSSDNKGVEKRRLLETKLNLTSCLDVKKCEIKSDENSLRQFLIKEPSISNGNSVVSGGNSNDKSRIELLIKKVLKSK
ncbi:unnamed protein product [Brachionus calyciflorus]|uniref:Uncharacterized protein n=1 Tax=Brachionus calyciflorus TaxID=104777 RepID=A0A813TP36_9BILA|nr:unnamed protein product [Brachionus calyciflorus]